MYQSEIRKLKEDIKLLPGKFEACTVLNSSFNGIEILGVRKVPNSRGLHCVFVDLEDYRGSEYVTLLNGSNWFGFTKPKDEVACHVDIYSTDNRIQLFGNDGQYSQVIGGLTFAHTQYGHSSSYIYAKFVKDNVIVSPPEPSEAIKLITEIEQQFQKLKGLIK